VARLLPQNQLRTVHHCFVSHVTIGTEIVLQYQIAKTKQIFPVYCLLLCARTGLTKDILSLVTIFDIFCIIILWQVDLGWLPDAHPAALSLPLLNRTGEENKMEKLVGQDKDRKTAYQLSSQTKRTQL